MRHNSALLSPAPRIHRRRRFVVAALLLPLLLAGCRRRHFPQYPSDFREYAWVANSGAKSVTVLDLVHMTNAGTIAVGANPTALAVSPTLNEVYVVNTGSDSVSVIDAARNQVASTIRVHHSPRSIDVDLEGQRAYVANAESNNISVLDLAKRRETAVVGVGEAPAAVRIAPDGNTIVASNRRSGSVSIIDAHGLRVREAFSGCPGADDVVILPDSSRAFVACSAGHQVMVVQLAHAAEPGGAARQDAVEAMLDVGRSPVDVALKPDGGEVFVSNFESNTISEISATTDDVSGAYTMGSHPARGLVSGDNALLYVSNFESQEVTVYSIDDGKRLGPSAPGAAGLGSGAIHVGDGPDALAFSANGKLLFVVDARSGDVAVVRTSDRSLFTLLPSGRKPNAIAIKAFTMRGK